MGMAYKNNMFLYKHHTKLYSYSIIFWGILFGLTLLTTYTADAQESAHGSCEEVRLAIVPSEQTNEHPWSRFLLKAIDLLEFRYGEGLHSDKWETLAEEMRENKKYAGWTVANEAKPPRYVLDIIAIDINNEESRITAEIRNVETCEVIVRETLNTLRITPENLKTWAEAIWNTLRSKGAKLTAPAEENGTPVVIFPESGSHRSIADRVREELGFGKSSSYDYSQTPRSHPVSEALLKFDYDIKSNGRISKGYVDGEDLEIVFRIRECDDKPISGFPLKVTLINPEQFLWPKMVLKGESGQKGDEIEIVSNDEGEARVFMSPPPGMVGTLILSIKKKSACGSELLPEIITTSQGETISREEMLARLRKVMTDKEIAEIQESYLVDKDIYIPELRETYWHANIQFSNENEFLYAWEEKGFRINGSVTLDFDFTLRKRWKRFDDPERLVGDIYNVVDVGSGSQSLQISPIGKCSIDWRKVWSGGSIQVLGQFEDNLKDFYLLIYPHNAPEAFSMRPVYAVLFDCGGASPRRKSFGPAFFQFFGIPRKEGTYTGTIDYLSFGFGDGFQKKAHYTLILKRRLN